MASIIDTSVPSGWCDRQIAIGTHTFQLWTPTDPDELLNHLESPESATQPHLADPYWAKLWPAAPILAAAVMRNPPPPGSRVLELGCGSGLVGIAALSCGAEVTFSDYVPLAVGLAQENAVRNGYAKNQGMVLDWRNVNSISCDPFPMILAADVTYDRTNIDPLLDVLDRLLAPKGSAWFGDAGRSPAAQFVQRASDRGWAVCLFDEQDTPTNRMALNAYRRIVLRRA